MCTLSCDHRVIRGADGARFLPTLNDWLSSPAKLLGQEERSHEHEFPRTVQGTVSPKFKELVALGIAVAMRCESCIAYHVHDALKAGATRVEIVETLGVAIMMGGGPASMYACDAFEALLQFEAQGAH